MNRGTGYQGPDVRDPEQRSEAFAGLSQRLEEKGSQFFWVRGRKVCLPTVTYGKWVPEQLKEGHRG